MTLLNRVRIERKAAECRAEILRLIGLFLVDTGEAGEAWVAGILGIDGVNAPSAREVQMKRQAGAPPPSVILGIDGVNAPSAREVQMKRQAGAPPPSVDHDETECDEIAELEEMVAEPELEASAPTGLNPETRASIPPAHAVEAPAEEPALKTGLLDDDERARVLELVAEQMTPAEIADRLGRPRRGFHLVVKNLVAATGVDAELPPAAEASTLPAPLHFEAMPGAPLQERALHEILNGLGYPEPWSPEADAALAETLARGDGIAAAVAALGVSRAAARARWDALLPVKGIEQQALAVKVLRDRATAHRAARAA